MHVYSMMEEFTCMEEEMMMMDHSRYGQLWIHTVTDQCHVVWSLNNYVQCTCIIIQ